MVGKREQLAGFLQRSGLVGAILRARARLPAPLSILTYHSVADRARPGFDDGVVDATPAQFDDQLAFIGRHFSVIGMDQLLAAVAGTGRLPANPLLITFDDGYRSCIDTAVPLLKRHGLVATFFIATDYVERRRIYWWDRLHYTVSHCSADRLVIDFPRRIELTLDDREAAAEQLVHLVKTEPHLDLEAFLDAVTSAAGLAWSDQLERDLADETIMTWDEIRRLRAAGMDVQSHTRRHRVLQTLETHELADELEGSRRDLEAQLDEPVRAIAYPVGRAVAHVPAIRAALQRAGYALGFSNATGVNYRLRQVDPLAIRRLAVDRGASDAFFRGSLAIPPLAYIKRDHRAGG